MAWINKLTSPNTVKVDDYFKNAGIDPSLMGWNPNTHQVLLGGNPIGIGSTVNGTRYANSQDLVAGIKAYQQSLTNPLSSTPTGGGTPNKSGDTGFVQPTSNTANTGFNAPTGQTGQPGNTGQGVTAADLSAGLARLGLTQDQYKDMKVGALSGDQGSINRLAQNKEVYGTLTGQPITTSVPRVTTVTPEATPKQPYSASASLPQETLVQMAGVGLTPQKYDQLMNDMSSNDPAAQSAALNEYNAFRTKLSLGQTAIQTPTGAITSQAGGGTGSTTVGDLTTEELKQLILATIQGDKLDVDTSGSNASIQNLVSSIDTGPVAYNPPDLNLPTMSFEDALAQARQRLNPMYQQSRTSAGAINQQQQELLRQSLNARGQLRGGLAQEGAMDLSGQLQENLTNLDVAYNTQMAELANAIQNQDWDRAFNAEQLASQIWNMQQNSQNANIGNMLSLAGLQQQGELSTAGLQQNASQNQIGNLLGLAGLTQQGDIAQQGFDIQREGLALDRLKLGQDNTQFYAGLNQDAAQFASQMGYNYDSLNQQDKWQMQDYALAQQGLDLQTRGQQWQEIYQSTLLGQEDQRIKLAEANQDFQIWATRQGIDIDWARLSFDQKRLEVDKYLEERAQSLQAQGLSIDAARVSETIRSNKAAEGIELGKLSEEDRELWKDDVLGYVEKIDKGELTLDDAIANIDKMAGLGIWPSSDYSNALKDSLKSTYPAKPKGKGFTIVPENNYSNILFPF